MLQLNVRGPAAVAQSRRKMVFLSDDLGVDGLLDTLSYSNAARLRDDWVGWRPRGPTNLETRTYPAFSRG